MCRFGLTCPFNWSRAQMSLPPAVAVTLAALPGVGRVAQTARVADCVQLLSDVARGAPAPPVLIAGLPDAVAPSRVVEAIKRHSPRSTVVLVADLGAPSAASAAFTAGADRVLARGLEPAQVRPRCCCCLCNASLRSPPHRTHARACHAART